MTMTHLSVVAFITAAIVMAAASVACDGRREVVMEWPTPAVPVADIAYDAVIRSAGGAGLQQQYYRARDEFLNAWRSENWPLAKESPQEYRRVMDQIEDEWHTRYREYWERQKQNQPAVGGY